MHAGWGLGIGRTCQQEVTLSDARTRMLLCDFPERRFDFCVNVESLSIDQAVEPLTGEQTLNFAEPAFDRLKLK